MTTPTAAPYVQTPTEVEALWKLLGEGIGSTVADDALPHIQRVGMQLKDPAFASATSKVSNGVRKSMEAFIRLKLNHFSMIRELETLRAERDEAERLIVSLQAKLDNAQDVASEANGTSAESVVEMRDTDQRTPRQILHDTNYLQTNGIVGDMLFAKLALNTEKQHQAYTQVAVDRCAMLNGVAIHDIGKLVQRKKDGFVPYRARDLIYDLDKGCFDEVRPALKPLRRQMRRAVLAVANNQRIQAHIADTISEIAQGAAAAYLPPCNPPPPLAATLQDYQDIIEQPPTVTAEACAEDYVERSNKRMRCE